MFVEDAEHGLRFIEVSEPSTLDVAEIVSAVHARVRRELRHLAIEDADQDSDEFAQEAPVLAACYAGSVTRRVALGPHAGKRVVKLGAEPNAPWVELERERHANHEGFDLHADVALHADDRQGLEQLLRYGVRPAVASDRLRLTPDGRVALTLKSSSRWPSSSAWLRSCRDPTRTSSSTAVCSRPMRSWAARRARRAPLAPGNAPRRAGTEVAG